MKDLRNPLTRTENFEHPSGNIMKELTEAELNSVAAGAGVARNSGGIACTLTVSVTLELTSNSAAMTKPVEQ